MRKRDPLASRDPPTWLPSPKAIEDFRAEVLGWFACNGRDLPWRHTRDPYRILVSEVMLQQTQVSRVLPYFDRFTDTFPTVASLAAASPASVLRFWQGLGYNRRAMYLHRAAMAVVQSHNSEFPSSLSELESLPGVGRYTARAVACFAFNEQVAVVETNVRKSISYFVMKFEPHAHADVDVDAIADALLPAGDAWRWNQALIDFGALYVPSHSANVMPARTRAGTAQTFVESNRFWRGRILAALCSQFDPVPRSSLLRELPDSRDEYRISGLLDQLKVEGLVSIDSDTGDVGLPQGHITKVRPE